MRGGQITKITFTKVRVLPRDQSRGHWAVTGHLLHHLLRLLADEEREGDQTELQ